MTSYYLAIGFYITLMLGAKFLAYVHTKRKLREREAQLLSDTQKEIERNRKASQETINKILQYSKSYVPKQVKGKYSEMHMN